MPRKKINTPIKKLDFPIFSIDGNDYLNEEAENAMIIQDYMQEILNCLDELSVKLENTGLQLNLYLNNIIKLDECFDFKKHIIMFDNHNNMFVHDHKIVDKIMNTFKEDEIDENILLDKLPKKKGYALNSKQYNKCFKFINDYNDFTFEYDNKLDQFEAYNEEYESIIESIKSVLSKAKLIEVDIDNDFNDIEMESFNDERHELVITQNEKNKEWNFIYIRKEDKNKLLDYMKKNGIQY